MKLFFLFCCIIIFLGCNSQSFFSPVGEWELYINKDYKYEEPMIPKITLTILADGKFIVSTIKGGRLVTNNGVWKQRGKTFFLIDDKGEQSSMMEIDGKDRIIIESQYLKKFGTQLLYKKITK